MAKLVGTGPKQVPTNADLGTLAYQDKDNVKLGDATLTGDITSTGGININTTDANGTGIALGLDGDKKVRFYDDQGATTKMYWNASTVTQKFEDNSKLAFGSSEDLQLYHDGTNNKLVGDLTQTGKPSTDEVDLSPIAATIADTAVDIFVYDTRKDSDGGAWRKRTQHTSWYNETLNTATRGSRKEFPAVAVIVAESNQVTIYDGDDPDLPMWMVFNRDSSTPDTTNAWWRNSSAIVASSIEALNGKLCITLNGVTSSSCGLLFLNFPSDNAGRYSDAGAAGGEGLAITDTFNNSLPTDLPAIVQAVCNDVAMTVLPNAPIDAATGLPVPTIAVATDGGVSVIKDAGTVVDIVYSGSPAITSVDASPKRMIFSATNGVVFASGYPTADVSSSSFSTLAGLLPDGAGYYSTTIPAVLGTVSKVAA